MSNSPSWSRPLAPQHVDARELARRQFQSRAGHDPLGARATASSDVHDELEDEFDEDLSDEFDEDPDNRSAGARHRAGIAPWRQEMRQRAADRVPPGVRALRWRVGRSAARGAAVVAVVVLLGLTVAAYLTWPRQDGTVAGQPVPPRTDPVAVSSPASSGSTPGSSAAPPGVATPSVSADVVVHVAGQVTHPGLVTLPAGSRVAAALAAAGGARDTADLDRLNLARPLVDGEQVLVPAPGEVLAVAPGLDGGAVGAGAAGGVAGPLDLNAATEDDLDALPGVGEVLAGRILAWRTEHSRFSDVEELGEVQGIGPKLLAGLRPLVRV